MTVTPRSLLGGTATKAARRELRSQATPDGDVKLRIERLAALLEVPVARLRSECSRRHLVDSDGCARLSTVRALSPEYETQIQNLLTEPDLPVRRLPRRAPPSTPDTSELLLDGPSGPIGPMFAILGEGDETKVRVGTLARMMRIPRQTLWRIATRSRIVDAQGLVRVADVRAISDDYDARVIALLEHARVLQEHGHNTSIARLERIEKAIDHIGAYLGIHAWSGTPTGK